VDLNKIVKSAKSFCCVFRRIIKTEKILWKNIEFCEIGMILSKQLRNFVFRCVSADDKLMDNVQ